MLYNRKSVICKGGKSIPTFILIKEGLIEHRDSKKTGGYYAK